MMYYIMAMPKVLVKLQNGEEIKGDVQSFNPNLSTFHLHIEGTQEKKVVSIDSVDAVFFLKKEVGEDTIIHTETIDQSSFVGTFAFRLHVEFNDGEMIHGSAHKYNPNDKGFFLVPLNPADKSVRIYVNAQAVKRVESRRFLGKILVDQNKISEAQLEHALRYQKGKREEKIGAILREHNMITNAQLEESLAKQKEHAKYLGEILLEAGYITEEQLQYALSLQKENRKKRLGQILVDLKYITPNDICIALATQLQLPWADLSSPSIPTEIATALPEHLVRYFEVIPITQKGDTLVVASGEPEEPRLIEEIGRHTRLKIEIAVAYEGYIESAINRFFPKKD